VCTQQPRDNRAIFFEDENSEPVTILQGGSQVSFLTATLPKHFISNAVVYARWGYNHTANQIFKILQDIFDDRIVSRRTENLWAPH